MLSFYRHNIFDVITLKYNKEGHLCTSEEKEEEEEDCKPEQVTHTLNQTLWPEHCVMDTQGAALQESLQVSQSDIVIRKGSNCEVSKLSTSIYDLVLIYVCHFHHHFLN